MYQNKENSKKKSLTGPPATLNAGVLGALLELKLFLYWGAGVKGAWQAGVATITKKGVDPLNWSFMKPTAFLFYRDNNYKKP